MTLDTDICIVGAGPAGLVLARELVARGREVVVIESGGAEPTVAADALNGSAAWGRSRTMRRRGRGRTARRSSTWVRMSSLGSTSSGRGTGCSTPRYNSYATRAT